MLKLYTHPFSIVPWRVRIVLHEKGLDYESVKTNLYTMEPTSAFLRLNPFAQIPVLDDDGFVIAESIAILEYLEEKYPDPILMPDDLQLRATARKLMCWGTDYWPPAWKMWMAPRLPKEMADPWTDASVSEGRRRIAIHLDVLEKQLANQEWLLADFTLADVCYAPFVLVLDRVDLGDEIESRASVKRWVNQLNDRRSIIETMMPLNP